MKFENDEIWQIVAIFAAIITAALPNFFDLRRKTFSMSNMRPKYRFTNAGWVILILFVIATVAAVWTTINRVYSEAEQKNKLTNILSKADTSLSKIDSILSSAERLYDSVLDIREQTAFLNDQMTNLSVAQRTISLASDLLLDDVLSQQEQTVQFNKIKLELAVSEIGRSHNMVWLWKDNDSVARLNLLISYTNQILKLLEGELTNPRLISNGNLYRFWKYILEKVKGIQNSIYGYNFTSVLDVNARIYNISMELMEMSESFLMYAPYYEMIKKDTNLYPVPKRLY